MIAQKDFHHTWGQARQYILQKDFEKAEKILSTLYSPEISTDLKIDYISVLIKIKQYSLAQVVLDHALIKHSKDPRLYALKASLLYIRHKPQEALSLYKMLIAEHPENPAYSTNAAYCACLLYRFEEACDFFHKSETELSVFPNSWLRNYAIALLMTKKIDRSKVYFQKLEDQSSLDSEEAFHFGLACDLLGENHEAHRLYTQAIEQDPLSIPPLYNLSILHQRAGLSSESHDLLAKILKIDPNHTLAKTLIAAANAEALPHLPLPFVEALFDQYSFNYDIHLKSVLEYKAPATARSLLLKYCPWAKPGIIMDLGAGTGVMGRVMRDLATHMTAVDCSAGMLLQAKMSHMYEEYIQDNLISWAAHTPLTANYFTLIEVSNYLGPALEGILINLWPKLQNSGAIVLTAEEHPAQSPERVYLQSCARFAFQEIFFHELFEKMGIKEYVVEKSIIRKHLDHDVMGLYVLAWKI